MRWKHLGLPRTVWAFGLASFFTDVASEAVYPSLPLLLGGLGAGAAIIGLIEGGAETTAALTKLYSGRLADRIQRHKSLILGGYGMAHVARPLIGLATSWPVVASLRLIDRFGKGLRGAPRDAVIARVVDRDQRGLAFGLHRSMDHAGALIGPLAAGLGLAMGLGLREIFLATAVPGAIALIVLGFGVDEPPLRPPIGVDPDERVLDRRGWRLVGASALLTLGIASDAFRILALSEAGLSAALVSLWWGLSNGLKMIVSPFAGLAADRFGRQAPILAGWACGGAAMVTFALGWGRSIPVAIAFIGFGLVDGLAEPAQKALIAEVCGKDKTGTAYGILHGAIGLAALPASLLFGALWSLISPPAAFLFGASLIGVACAVLPREARS